MPTPSQPAQEWSAYFIADDGSFAPRPAAKGPWGPAISGHVVGGLLGAALEVACGDEELQPARLTVDLLRPALMEPVRVDSRIIRDGRRLRLTEAVLLQGDAAVSRASAVFLRRGEQPEQAVWTAPITMPPLPTGHYEEPSESSFFIQTYGWGPDAPNPADDESGGQKFAWVREVRALIESEPLTPFARAAMAADVTSAITQWGLGGMPFINADYTLALSRSPRGPFVGLAAHTHTSHGGVAVGGATLFDEQGSIGSVVVTALADGRFRPQFAG